MFLKCGFLNCKLGVTSFELVIKSSQFVIIVAFCNKTVPFCNKKPGAFCNELLSHFVIK